VQNARGLLPQATKLSFLSEIVAECLAIAAPSVNAHRPMKTPRLWH